MTIVDNMSEEIMITHGKRYDAYQELNVNKT